MLYYVGQCRAMLHYVVLCFALFCYNSALAWAADRNTKLIPSVYDALSNRISREDGRGKLLF